MNRQKLKSYFRTGKKPTEAQFAEWIDACWFRGEQVKICDVLDLNDRLKEKADVNNIQFIIDNYIGGTVELPVHSLCGSANITEKLEITGVAYNRNCSSLFFMDKENIENTLIVHLRELEEEEEELEEEIICAKCAEHEEEEEVDEKEEDGDDFKVDPISLEKFYNTSVYIFASEIEKGKKVDVSLTLRNVKDEETEEK